MDRLARTAILECIAGCFLLTSSVFADEWSGEFSLQGRLFNEQPLDSEQHGGEFSLSAQAEYHAGWDGGRQSLTFKPFFRASEYHAGRTHMDIRELYWLMTGTDWEIRIGIDKVFWGVTEAHHLVDIINQSDMLESLDGEEKLGQPMLKYSLEGNAGTLDAYLLPGFRERAFPNQQGRLRLHPAVDVNNAQYLNDHGKNYPGWALRWSRSVGDWDIGLAHFHGISREPELRLSLDEGDPVLVPYYDVIDQNSVDIQVTDEGWLWKFEALHRSGLGKTFSAATGGFEYTFVGIDDTDMDLGVLLELIYDDRSLLAPTPFNRDVFLGLRWLANDIAGTEVLLGSWYDWKNRSRFLGVEANRRLIDDWKLQLQLRRWLNIAPEDPSYIYRNDDYIEAKLIKYL